MPCRSSQFVLRFVPDLALSDECRARPRVVLVFDPGQGAADTSEIVPRHALYRLLSAISRLSLGYLLATSWLQLGSSSAASKPHLAEALSEQPRCAAIHVLHAALLAHATQLPNHRLGGDPLAPRLLSHGRRRRVGHAASAPAQRLFLLRDVDARDLEKGVERPRSDEMESGTRHIRPCGDMCPPTRP